MRFISPTHQPCLLALCRHAVPWVLCARGVVSVECPADDLERLRALGNERVVLTPNHPTRLDPLVLFHLSGLVGQRFHFAANRESFDYAWGLWGWLIGRLGAYSIVRGGADLPALKLTRRLLARPAARLVLFPEGEVYSRFEEPLPFHPGVAQVAFWAQEDLVARGHSEAVYLLPVALRYRLTDGTRVALGNAVDRLWWSACGDPGPFLEDEWVRLSLLADRLASRLETDWGGPRSDESNLNERIGRLAGTVLSHAAALLGVPLPDGAPHDQIRFVINTAQRDMHHRTAARDRRELLSRLQRLINWVALSEGLSLAQPTLERLMDVTQRLEIEVLGRVRTVAKRRCLMRIGEPLNVTSLLDAYHQSKRAAVQMLTDKLQAAVQGCLDTMGETGL
jgi:1-acyl-sn-glycerol-3-phosphate acyltransferase